MIERLQISGIHIKVEDDLHKYINKKIGKLDQYLPKHARLSTHGEVRLRAFRTKNRKLASCEVVLHLPHDVIIIKETTLNMFAAVDIVEAKLKNQLKKYKGLHSRDRIHHRVLARVLRRQPA